MKIFYNTKISCVSTQYRGCYKNNLKKVYKYFCNIKNSFIFALNLKTKTMNYQEQQDLLQEQEYKQRKYWYVFECKGRAYSSWQKDNEKFGLPKDFIFNPRHTEATEEEFDKLIDLIIYQGESEFKLIGTHKYSSLEELNKIWK